MFVGCICAASWFCALLIRSSLPDYSGYRTDRLILELCNMSRPIAGLHPTAWTSSFYERKRRTKFRGGVLGSEAPSRNFVVEEILKRGATAIPFLLDRISDVTPTGIVLKGDRLPNWGTYTNYYNSRPLREVPAFKATKKYVSFPFRLRLGEVCLFLIGEIVNRPQTVMRYVPSGGFTCCSPIEYSEVADLAREDWKNFSITDHESLLIRDIHEALYEEEKSGAILRLMYYYPASITRLLSSGELSELDVANIEK